MGIFTRVSDIISANLADMVERFESPETMLHQALREMDAAIARTMEATARAIADERLIEHELSRHHDRSADLLASARAAVARSDETAARRSLVQRQEQETLVAALSDQLNRVRASTSKLRVQLDAMRVRRLEAQRTLNVLIARNRAAAARREFATSVDDCYTDVGGSSRFERLRKRIERREAEADAFLELAACIDAAVPEPETDRAIEAQLQAMRVDVAAAAEGQR